ncbi:MAG: hypothetical protein HYV14_01965 [Elusimicrobia bacterium]|nr:hypothetical protein [Elusimicrobiota bacterium]
MNYEENTGVGDRRAAGEYELESGHERRQRLRSERIRKWRKETRHPRAGDGDDRLVTALPRRFTP